MARTRGIGASLAQQLKSTAPVLSISAARGQHMPAKTEPATDRSGSDWIAIFPRPGKSPQRVDLSFLMSLPNVGPLLFDGFRRWAEDKEPNSRHGLAISLKNGLCTFLREQGLANIYLHEVTRTHLAGFVDWLNRPDAVVGKPYRLKTREALLQALRSVLRGLQSSPKANLARQVLRLVPKRNWPGIYRKGKPRERLSREHLLAILKAAEEEVRALPAMLDEGAGLIEAGRNRQPLNFQQDRPIGTNTPNPYGDKAICLAALQAHLCSTGQVIRFETLKAENRTLFAAVSKHKFHNITKYLYPQSYELVPIVVLLTIATALNAETAVTLSWSGVTEDEIFGAKIVRIEGQKKRALADPILPLPAETVRGVGVGLLVEIVRRWTARLRPLAPVPMRDRMFIFSGVGGLPSTFGSDDYPHAATTGTWHSALKKWCRDNGLEPFALSQIRSTVLDEVQQRTGDILQARSLGRHRRIDTTWRHYTSDGTRKRYQERLGIAFMVRDRWVDTNGTIDPRERTETQDKGAATPGFFCFDPYDSPQPGQKQGRLCTAYGRCPACPLAAANLGDVTSVALYRALRNAIVESQPLMSPQVFREQWHGVLGDLDALLVQIPASVVNCAAGIKVVLPPVG